jgi:membrane dipeptidase
MMMKPMWSWAGPDIDPRVAAIVARTIGVDTHNHIDVPLDTDELPGPDVDLAGELKKSGLSAICMTFATDYKRNVQPGEAYQRFLNGLSAMDILLERNKMRRSFTLADIQTAHKEHRPTVIQSVEGCHFLEGNLDRVEVAYKRGVRHLGLLHDSNASVPLGDVYTNPPEFGGLTSFGSDVIKEANRLGMLVDLAHASNGTIAAALKIATAPVLISHTGLDTQLGSNPNMAKMMRPRLISKEEAKIVADAGGVIGVWTHLADTPEEYAKNIRALVDVTGVDHVAIGTDTKMTPAYRSPHSNFGGPPPGGPGGQSGPPPGGGGPGGPGGPGGRPGERTNMAWADEKVGFYYAVVDALLKVGFSEAEIEKIGGGNFCRVFNASVK